VAASPILREKFRSMAEIHAARAGWPPPHYAGDNGAMIAWVGLLNYLAGITVEPARATVRQRWRLDLVEVPWRG
jgi:N6-L-threonylcarbamoyladenine synthase